MAKKLQPEPDPGQKMPAKTQPGPENKWPDPALIKMKLVFLAELFPAVKYFHLYLFVIFIVHVYYLAGLTLIFSISKSSR